MKVFKLGGIALIGLFLLSACVPGRFAARLPVDRFEAEIATLNAVIEKDPASPAAAEAYLKLTFLYSSYRNPQKDYAKAQETAERFVKLNPAGGEQYEIQNLLALLREINGVRGKGQIRALTTANAKLVAEKEALAEEIKKLEETIEKLKNLDMELEKKRKSFK